MKFADEAIKQPRNASLELDLELVGIGRLSGKKGGTAPGHDWSSLEFRERPVSVRHNLFPPASFGNLHLMGLVITGGIHRHIIFFGWSDNIRAPIFCARSFLRSRGFRTPANASGLVSINFLVDWEIAKKERRRRVGSTREIRLVSKASHRSPISHCCALSGSLMTLELSEPGE